MDKIIYCNSPHVLLWISLNLESNLLGWDSQNQRPSLTSMHRSQILTLKFPKFCLWLHYKLSELPRNRICKLIHLSLTPRSNDYKKGLNPPNFPMSSLYLCNTTLQILLPRAGVYFPALKSRLHVTWFDLLHAIKMPCVRSKPGWWEEREMWKPKPCPFYSHASQTKQSSDPCKLIQVRLAGYLHEAHIIIDSCVNPVRWE